MKRAGIVILAVLFLASPQPRLVKSQQPSDVSDACPTYGEVIFVGNEVVDLNSSPTSCSGEIYYKRDGVEIPASRGQFFYRDAGLSLGSTHEYERCCDTGGGSDLCKGLGSATLGQVDGYLCQDLDWYSGTYDHEGGNIKLVDGTVLTIVGATVKKLRISTGWPPVDDPGKLHIEDSTFEDVDLSIASPGDNYIQNSNFLGIDDSFSSELDVRGWDVTTISGNTFSSYSVDLSGEESGVGPEPRIVVTQNVFHNSDLNIEMDTPVTISVTVTDNQFINGRVLQQGAKTTIANNLFVQMDDTDLCALIIASGIAQIEDNTIHGYGYNSDLGCGLSTDAEVTVTGNILTNNKTGMILRCGVQVIATGNTFTENQTAISASACGQDESLTIHGNCIAGNSVGLKITYGGELDARNNWWGDPSGPYNETWNPEGKGDSVVALYHTAETFDPWLTTDNCSTALPATLALELPTDPLPADGLTQIDIHAVLSNDQGPIPGAMVKLDVSPDLGELWPASVWTDAQGRATVHYQVPSQEALGGEALSAPNQDPQVTVTASGGGASASDNLTFQTGQPRIENVEVKAFGTLNNQPETGSWVALFATFTEPAGYQVSECFWQVTDGPVLRIKPLGNQCTYGYVPPTQHMHKGLYRPPHGLKKVTIVLTYLPPGNSKLRSSLHTDDFKLFFSRGEDHDRDGVPNWFEYWPLDVQPYYPSGSVPKASNLYYEAWMGSGTAGSFRPEKDKIAFGPRAAGDDPGVHISAGPGCPGLDLDPTQGIDTFFRIADREIRRQIIYHNWDEGGYWDGHLDTDDETPGDKRDWWKMADNLPDHEEEKLGTRIDHVDSCNIEPKDRNGDQEFDCLRETKRKQVPQKWDWANPGKQAGGLTSRAMAESSAAGAPASSSGPAPGVAPANAGDLVASALDFAALTGTYSDDGVDDDGDGLFDQLELSVGLVVTETELYNVVAWLEGGSGTLLGWAATQATLSPGNHTVDLFFDGRLIQESGLDGPYTVSMVELRLGPRELLLAAPENVHTTAAYGFADFDPPDVSFTGAFSDQGIDSDTDGLYDQLRIEVGLDVQESGTYTVTGELSQTHTIAISQTSANLAAGPQTLSLDFDGTAIFHNRQDGPYQLAALRVEDASGNQVDFLLDAFTTGSYAYSSFQHGGTTFDATSYADRGVDINYNGQYDSLQFSLALDVDQQDTYLLLAHLTDGAGITIQSLARQVDLAAGKSTVSLDFSGRAISAHGVDGPYIIASLVLLASDGTPLDHHPLAHTTQAYSWTQFEYLGLVYLPLVTR